MKRKTIITFSCLVLAIGLAGYNHQYCRYGYPFITMSSGLSYKPMRSGNGRKVQKGEWMQLSFEVTAVGKKQGQMEQAKQDNKVKLISEPNIFLPFDDTLLKAFRAGAEMIEEKQRMIFKFSPQYFWAEKDPTYLEEMLKIFQLKADDELEMDISLIQIMTEEQATQMMEARRTAQLAKDKEAIMAYLAAHNIQACSTDSGLFYIIDQVSQDIPVEQNKTVKINYTGKLLLDGTVFDTSREEVAKANNIYRQRAYKPFEFSVGVGKVIAGWDEGLLLLKKNEKARFFIPSSLAYGEHGYDAIPANATLLFEVEVVDVI